VVAARKTAAGTVTASRTGTATGTRATATAILVTSETGGSKGGAGVVAWTAGAVGGTLVWPWLGVASRALVLPHPCPPP
jgi:hypothetical protein